jgi:hypothetical protein
VSAAGGFFAALAWLTARRAVQVSEEQLELSREEILRHPKLGLTDFSLVMRSMAMLRGSSDILLAHEHPPPPGPLGTLLSTPCDRARFTSGNHAPSRSRLLSQSSYFWPLGMVAPSRDLT